MSRIRLYVDEDAAQTIVVEGLIEAGFDVLTAQQAGNRSATDDAQLQFAISESRAIYSLNASDFYRLHAEWMSSGRSHHGIIVFTSQRYGPGEKLRRIRAHLETTSAEAMRDQMSFL